MTPLPIFIAALAYWVLGAVWYSALFGGIWSRGLEVQGIKLKEPTSAQLGLKLALTFVANVAASTAINYLIDRTSTTGLLPGICLGATVGIGIAAAALSVAYTWEGKPLSVYFVDITYHILGCVVVAAILTLWR